MGEKLNTLSLSYPNPRRLDQDTAISVRHVRLRVMGSELQEERRGEERERGISTALLSTIACQR